ncbi:hypothetical protein GCM10010924_42630 [Rhizobium wenxiniae]|nr:hypothetical protein GCM10010924_42630 [Rhizobium wenxiniae]
MDFKNRDYYTPIGLGVGKHWALTTSLSIDAYVEPQYSVIATGGGVPRWQIFAGLNF